MEVNMEVRQSRAIKSFRGWITPSLSGINLDFPSDNTTESDSLCRPLIPQARNSFVCEMIGIPGPAYFRQVYFIIPVFLSLAKMGPLTEL